MSFRKHSEKKKRKSRQEIYLDFGLSECKCYCSHHHYVNSLCYLCVSVGFSVTFHHTLLCQVIDKMYLIKLDTPRHIFTLVERGKDIMGIKLN